MATNNPPSLPFASLAPVRAPITIIPGGDPGILSAVTPEKRAALNERLTIIDLVTRHADFSQEALSDVSQDRAIDVDAPARDKSPAVPTEKKEDVDRDGGIPADNEPAPQKNPMSPGGEEPEEERRRVRGPNFTSEEDQAILQFAEEHGENKWSDLISRGVLQNRNVNGVRQRYRALTKKEKEKDGEKDKERVKKDTELSASKVKAFTKEKAFATVPFPNSALEKEANKNSKRKLEERDEKDEPFLKKTRTISQGDPVLKAPTINEDNSMSVPSIAESKPDSKPTDDSKLKLLREIEELKANNEKLEHQLSELEIKVRESDELRAKVTAGLEYKKEAKKTLIDLVRNQGEIRRRDARRKLHDNIRKYGRIEVEVSPFGNKQAMETFVDGEAFVEIQSKLKAVASKKEEIKQRKNAIKKLTGAQQEIDLEILTGQGTLLTQEEKAISAQLETLKQEKVLHLKEMRRIREEDHSQLLNQAPIQPSNDPRFVITELIGKGGFSEVYKAFDVEDLRIVAIKVLQLNQSWSDAKKENYTKHAIREYQIHRDLSHPNIVPLYYIFELTQISFCTVLEFCDGGDLDEHLKKNGSLQVKEARLITLQIFDGLKYLHERQPPIIHYDLKPGNILFDGEGRVKITDFGLSKQMEETESGAMDLTSQGAGTYWYLPPECFMPKPKITPTVDVWSAGVILFQMLIGQKPFGHGKDQNEVMNNKLININSQVQFPAKPSIPDEAKKFIERCLTTRQQDRPTAATMIKDPFLDVKAPKRVPPKQ